MGIEVEGYKLGGGSLCASVYVQLGRQPIAVQRKNKQQETSGPLTNQFVYETIYVATAHGSRDDVSHICVVRQGGVRTDQPVTGDVYALCYADLKKNLTEEGYTFTDLK